MIVVDTNVIAYVLLPGAHSELARAAIARDPVWAAPLLWRSELRNVLATYLRREHLTLAEAARIQATAESFVEGREFAVDSATVLELAASSGCSAYDCEFIALARALDVDCVTSDRALAGAFPETVVTLRRFAAGGAR